MVILQSAQEHFDPCQFWFKSSVAQRLAKRLANYPVNHLFELCLVVVKQLVSSWQPSPAAIWRVCYQVINFLIYFLLS